MIPEPDIALLCEMYADLTRRELAVFFGITEAQVKDRLAKAGVFKRKQRDYALSKTQLEELYALGLSSTDIASECGLSLSHVQRLRRYYGLPPQQPIINNRPADATSWRLDASQHEMLLGTLMGDSSIVPVRSSFRFISGHCEAQQEYLEHKRDLLAQFAWDLRPVCKDLGGKLFHGFRLETFAHAEWAPYRKLFYPDGVKRFTPELACQLTPRSLAYWLMDDGGLSGKVVVLGYHTLRADLEVVRDTLQERFGVGLRIDRHSQKLFRLVASTKLARAWVLEYVKPHVIPSMQYKVLV